MNNRRNCTAHPQCGVTKPEDHQELTRGPSYHRAYCPGEQVYMVDIVSANNYQSHICRTFRLTLRFFIHPTQVSFTPGISPTPGHSSIVVSASLLASVCKTLGTECHAQRDSPPMSSTSPDLILSTRILSSFSSFSDIGPQSPIIKTASVPILILASGADEASEMSRWGESVSPGVYRFDIAACGLRFGN